MQLLARQCPEPVGQARGGTGGSRTLICRAPGDRSPVELRTRWWSERDSNPHFCVATAASSRWTITPAGPRGIEPRQRDLETRPLPSRQTQRP